MELKDAIKAAEGKLDPQKTKGLNAIYQFDLTGEGAGSFCISFTDGIGNVTEGENGEAKVLITISGENFMKLAEGKLNPNMAFMTGKLKLKGDMALGLKLQAILG